MPSFPPAPPIPGEIPRLHSRFVAAGAHVAANGASQVSLIAAGRAKAEISKVGSSSPHSHQKAHQFRLEQEVALMRNLKKIGSAADYDQVSVQTVRATVAQLLNHIQHSYTPEPEFQDPFEAPGGKKDVEDPFKRSRKPAKASENSWPNHAGSSKGRAKQPADQLDEKKDALDDLQATCSRAFEVMREKRELMQGHQDRFDAKLEQTLNSFTSLHFHDNPLMSSSVRQVPFEGAGTSTGRRFFGHCEDGPWDLCYGTTPQMHLGASASLVEALSSDVPLTRGFARRPNSSSAAYQFPGHSALNRDGPLVSKRPPSADSFFMRADTNHWLNPKAGFGDSYWHMTLPPSAGSTVVFAGMWKHLKTQSAAPASHDTNTWNPFSAADVENVPVDDAGDDRNNAVLAALRQKSRPLPNYAEVGPPTLPRFPQDWLFDHPKEPNQDLPASAADVTQAEEKLSPCGDSNSKGVLPFSDYYSENIAPMSSLAMSPVAESLFQRFSSKPVGDEAAPLSAMTESTERTTSGIPEWSRVENAGFEESESEAYVRRILNRPSGDKTVVRIIMDALALSPLPGPWEFLRDEENNTPYFWNTETNEVSWDHPLQQFFIELAMVCRVCLVLPLYQRVASFDEMRDKWKGDCAVQCNDWLSAVDSEGRIYWYNKCSGESSWVNPSGTVVPGYCMMNAMADRICDDNYLETLGVQKPAQNHEQRISRNRSYRKTEAGDRPRRWLSSWSGPRFSVNGSMLRRSFSEFGRRTRASQTVQFFNNGVRTSVAQVE